MQRKPHYQSDHATEKLEGIVSFLLLGKGSLHEREAPIINGNFGFARILIPTENPLEQPHLKSLVGATILASGIWKRGVLHCEKGDITIVTHGVSTERTENKAPKVPTDSAVPLPTTTSSSETTTEANKSDSPNLKEEPTVLIQESATTNIPTHEMEPVKKTQEAVPIGASTDKPCPVCHHSSRTIANFCWNCGHPFHDHGGLS